MRNIFKIFFADVKRISTNVVAVVVNPGTLYSAVFVCMV